MLAHTQDNLGVMSIGFMLPDPDSAVVWRGPRKNGLIKQFLKDVDWGELDYLVIDTPPGTSDEHISMAQYLKATGTISPRVWGLNRASYIRENWTPNFRGLELCPVR